MKVHLNVRPPIDMVLGFSKTPSGVSLVVDILPGNDFASFMEKLAEMYPDCQRLTNPEDNIFKEMLIVVNGEVVLSNELHRVSLQDPTNISFVMRYQGG